jgi:hypothetical protein
MTLLALFIVGFCDRIRGGFPEGERPKWLKYLCMTLVGPILSLQATTDPLILGLSVLIGHIIWRQDNGYKGRFVVENPKYDIVNGVFGAARWGALASLFFLPFAYFDKTFFCYPVAFVAGNIVSHIISMFLPKTDFFQLRNAWPWSELISLPIIGAIAWTANLFI